jgi:hypothetical protein
MVFLPLSRESCELRRASHTVGEARFICRPIKDGKKAAADFSSSRNNNRFRFVAVSQITAPPQSVMIVENVVLLREGDAITAVVIVEEKWRME